MNEFNEQSNIVSKEKSNTGLKVVIVFLVIAVLALAGYICYDKFFDKGGNTNGGSGNTITNNVNNSTGNNENNQINNNSTNTNNENNQSSNSITNVDNRTKAIDLSKCLNCEDIKLLYQVSEYNQYSYRFKDNVFKYNNNSRGIDQRTGIGTREGEQENTVTFDSKIVDVIHALYGQSVDAEYYLFLLEDGTIKGFNIEKAYQQNDIPSFITLDYKDIVRFELVTAKDINHHENLSRTIAVKSDGTFYLVDDSELSKDYDY